MQGKVDKQQLSIIITTSPIRSHPDTQIIDDSINSILKQPTLQKIHIYIVCDGAKIAEQNKHKSGIITAQTMKNYELYKQKLHEKYGVDKDRFTIVQREVRCGFAENIRYLMRDVVGTQFVMIYQHDHVIQRQVDFAAVIHTMIKFRCQINYVTFMHKSYKTILARIISNTSVRDYLVKLIGKQQGYNTATNQKQFERDVFQYFQNKFELPLVPLNFWYDKVHVASRQFYLDVVFNDKGNFDPNKGKFVKTISFPEDSFGHAMKYSIIQRPQKLLQYGAYILWDEHEVFYHQNGRAFICQEQKQKCIIAQKQQQNYKSQSSQQQQNQQIDLSTLL